jgi:anthranilate synthase component 2
MKKVLVIDNYDSFTYNLVHYLEELQCSVKVVRNDKVSFSEAASFDHMVLSPGPGIPDEAGRLKELIQTFAAEKRILGVCLGQQAIAEVFGGQLINLQQVYHGVATTIEILGDDSLYKGLPSRIEVGRYHSWVVAPELPDCLEVTAVDDRGAIMSLRHREFDVRGVQYHPESVLTPQGKEILSNWLNAIP